MILRLFEKSNAGKCLNAVKKEWGCIGENLSKIPGVRYYNTIEGDTVTMISKPGGLEVKRHIASANMNKLKKGEYKGKLFKVINDVQNWYNVNYGDGFIFFKKFRWIFKYANQDENLLKTTKISDSKGCKKDEKTGIIAEFIRRTKLWRRLQYKNGKLIKIVE